jgi:hypothetical protein
MAFDVQQFQAAATKFLKNDPDGLADFFVPVLEECGRQPGFAGAIARGLARSLAKAPGSFIAILLELLPILIQMWPMIQEIINKLWPKKDDPPAPLPIP